MAVWRRYLHVESFSPELKADGAGGWGEVKRSLRWQPPDDRCKRTGPSADGC